MRRLRQLGSHLQPPDQSPCTGTWRRPAGDDASSGSAAARPAAAHAATAAAGRHVVIVGATGVVGRAAVEHFNALGGWCGTLATCAALTT